MHITVYTLPACSQCNMTKNWLDRRQRQRRHPRRKTLVRIAYCEVIAKRLQQGALDLFGALA